MRVKCTCFFFLIFRASEADRINSTKSKNIKIIERFRLFSPKKGFSVRCCSLCSFAPPPVPTQNLIHSISFIVYNTSSSLSISLSLSLYFPLCNDPPKMSDVTYDAIPTRSMYKRLVISLMLRLIHYFEISFVFIWSR